MVWSLVEEHENCVVTLRKDTVLAKQEAKPGLLDREFRHDDLCLKTRAETTECKATTARLRMHPAHHHSMRKMMQLQIPSWRNYFGICGPEVLISAKDKFTIKTILRCLEKRSKHSLMSYRGEDKRPFGLGFTMKVFKINKKIQIKN